MKRVLGDRVYETTCCGKRRPESNVVLTIWQVGQVAWGFIRCADSKDCEYQELEDVRDLSAPYWRTLAN